MVRLHGFTGLFRKSLKGSHSSEALMQNGLLSHVVSPSSNIFYIHAPFLVEHFTIADGFNYILDYILENMVHNNICLYCKHIAYRNNALK